MNYSGKKVVKMYNEIKANSEIAIINKQGDHLTFSAVDMDQDIDLLNLKKYKEIKISNKGMIISGIAQTGLQIGNQILSLSKIASQAPNGLYSATTNPETLSKLSNGLTSTIIRKNGKIVEHAGFKEVGLHLNLNPAMALSIGMQAMSMISGTYYLNKINSQLTSINSKLSELIELHHDENIGELQTIRSGLADISNRTTFDDSDIATIRDYKKDADNIEKEYINRLDRFSKENVIEKKLDDLDQFILNLNKTTEIANQASIYSLMCELSELFIRMKRGDDSLLIEELISQFEKHYQSSFYNNSTKKNSHIYNSFLQSIKNEVTKLTKKKKKSFGKLAATTGTLYLSGFIGLGAVAGTKKISKELKLSKLRKKELLLNNNYTSIKSTISLSKNQLSIPKVLQELKTLPTKNSDFLLLDDGSQQRIFIEE